MKNFTFNPITFIKSLVTLNNLKQEYVQYSSTKYPNGQVVRGVDVVSIKTIAPPSRIGKHVDVRV